MTDLFRWTLGASFLVLILTGILNVLGGRVWLQWAVMAVIALFALIRGVQKYGVPDSAFRSGAALMLASLAALLIGSSVQEWLELVIIIVLFVVVYYVGGFIASRIQRMPQDEEREDWPPKREEGEQLNEIPEGMQPEPAEPQEVTEPAPRRRIR
jgi:hypothetical protein